MAEALFRKYLDDARYSDDSWVVASAGCWAYPGMSATQKAIQAASDMDATTIHFHESKAISEDLLEVNNLILCMESGHVDFIKRHFHQSAKKVFLLSEMIDDIFEIEDPVGQSQEIYQTTADELLSIIKTGFDKIKELSVIRP